MPLKEYILCLASDLLLQCILFFPHVCRVFLKKRQCLCGSDTREESESHTRQYCPACLHSFIALHGDCLVPGVCVYIYVFPRGNAHHKKDNLDIYESLCLYLSELLSNLG